MTVEFCNLTSEIYCKIWQTLPTIGFLICCINHRFHHVLVTLMQTTLEYPFSRDSWRIHIIFWAEGEKNVLSSITYYKAECMYILCIIKTKGRDKNRFWSSLILHQTKSIRYWFKHLMLHEKFHPTRYALLLSVSTYSHVDMNKAFKV